MAALAFRGAANRRLRRGERIDHLGVVAAKAADHIERRNRHAAECETGIARQRLLENPDRIAGQAIIVGNRPIEGRSRLGRAGELETLLVLGHGSVP
jgi:hypothetical protein